MIMFQPGKRLIIQHRLADEQNVQRRFEAFVIGGILSVRCSLIPGGKVGSGFPEVERGSNTSGTLSYLLRSGSVSFVPEYRQS